MRFYVEIWIAAIIAIPASLTLFVLNIWHLALPIFVFALTVRLDFMRIMIRVGGYGTAPYACSSEKILKIYHANKPTIVGRGWGFFLQRRTANTPILAMYNFTGRRYGDSWGSGTTIETVASYYKKRGKTFPSHPSYDDITIGSWFAAGCHGSGGDSGNPSSSVFKSAEVVFFSTKAKTPIEVVTSYKRLRTIFDNKDCNCVITWVEFHNLVDNKIVQKRAFDVKDEKGALQWLETGAILRVLFVGKARNGLGIRWENEYNSTTHYDPHCCSKCSTFVQADICSSYCGYKENYSEWEGKTTLLEANKWSPPIFPIEVLMTVLGHFINFEIIFRIKDMNATLLYSMVQKLKHMHNKIGGRTEIRFGTAVMFWDLSLNHSFDCPFEILYDMDIKRVALHPSKYNPYIPIIRKKMQIVSVGDIYFNRMTPLKF